MRMSTFNSILLKLDKTRDRDDIVSLIRYVLRNGLQLEEVASLAVKLANSGALLPAISSATADVASTGGPSSLSTLICPLFLKLKGFTIPKLAVPGRPAGGIDVLATIPGYKASLSPEEVVHCLEECRYSHFLAGEDFVPLDARMFRIRQEIGAQDNPSLVIASLIAKKIAASVTHVRLDVRVGPHGNFGRTLDDARANAQRFNSVADMVRLDSGCYLTDATAIYQPYIGRGEALVALALMFSDNADSWLRDHIHTCWAMTEGLGIESSLPEMSSVKRVFEENLAAQGSHLRDFELRVDELWEAKKTTVLARSTGYLQIDLSMLRHLLVEAQRACDPSRSAFTDPCGVELLVQPGHLVDRDQPIARVRGMELLHRVSDSDRSNIDSVFDVVSPAEPIYHSSVPFESEWVVRGAT